MNTQPQKTLTKLILALTTSASMAIAIPAKAGGIPVIDSSQLAQQIQQVASWAQQLKAMGEQFKLQQTQFQSMTGNRGYGNVLNDPKLQQYYKSNLPSPQQLQQQYGDIDPCRTLSDAQAISACKALQAKPFEDYNQIQQAIMVSEQRSNQIQSLITLISQTDDPKSIAELQARIQGEQVAIQNEKIRMELTLRNQELQNQAMKDYQSQLSDARTKAEIDAAYKKFFNK